MDIQRLDGTSLSQAAQSESGRSRHDAAAVPAFFQSLQVRLLAALTFIALISVGGLGIAAYQDERAVLESQVSAQLTSVADLKQSQIVVWLDERQADTRLLAVNKLNQEHFTEILSPDVPEGRKKEFAAFVTDNLISLQQSRPGYVEIMMVSLDGRIILATDPDRVGQQINDDPTFRQTVAAADGHYIHDIHSDPRLNLTVMKFGHIMYTIDLETLVELPEIIGVVISVLDMSPTIYPILAEWPAMGETGEMILARIETEDALVLNQLRFDPDAALTLRLPASADLPESVNAAALAARGEEGITQTVDYRQTPVLAAYRHIPLMGWGFVIKEDLDEAFAPVRSLAHRLTLFAVGVLFTSGLVSVALSRSLIRPLNQLVQAAHTVTAGQFDAEMPQSRPDEIGVLANSFQTMIAALKQRHQEMETARGVLHDLNARPDVIETFPTIVNQLQRITTCNSLSLSLFDPQSEEFTIVALAQPLPALRLGLTFSGRDTVIVADVLAGRPHVTSDLASESKLDLDRQLYEAGYRSRINLPLQIQGRVVGVLTLGWLRTAGCQPEHLPLLNQIADGMALAVERSRLFNETRQRAEELATLTELSAALRLTDTLAEMLPVFLEKAIRAIRGLSGILFLVEDQTGELATRGCQPPVQDCLHWRRPLGQGIAKLAIATGQMQIVNLAVNRANDPLLEAYPNEPIMTIVWLPLQTQDKTVGVVGIGLGEQRHLTLHETHLLTAMAEVAGNALHRASVMETLEQRVANRTHELAMANERLQELDRLKSKFVAEVSHELRTPIANLLLYTQLAVRGKPERRDAYLVVLQEQAERLSYLTDDILNLSRLENVPHEKETEPVNLNELVEHIVEAHLPRAERAGLELRTRLSPELPLASGVGSQLTQVITNLVSNALNYTDNGFVEIASYCDEAGWLCLEVNDSGDGIEPEDLPYLFERFYRGQRHSQSNIPGTGLGLAIVKEIVERHGGQVEVESQVGRGSIFRARLRQASV
jgi:signal transduction histidine kinase